MFFGHKSGYISGQSREELPPCFGLSLHGVYLRVAVPVTCPGPTVSDSVRVIAGSYERRIFGLHTARGPMVALPPSPYAALWNGFPVASSLFSTRCSLPTAHFCLSGALAARSIGSSVTLESSFRTWASGSGTLFSSTIGVPMMCGDDVWTMVDLRGFLLAGPFLAAPLCTAPRSLPGSHSPGVCRDGVSPSMVPPTPLVWLASRPSPRLGGGPSRALRLPRSCLVPLASLCHRRATSSLSSSPLRLWRATSLCRAHPRDSSYPMVRLSAFSGPVTRAPMLLLRLGSLCAHPDVLPSHSSDPLPCSALVTLLHHPCRCLSPPAPVCLLAGGPALVHLS